MWYGADIGRNLPYLLEVEAAYLSAYRQCATERSLFFDLKYLNRLTDMLDNLSVEVAGVKSGASGNVRMDVMITKDSEFVAAQLFQFVPYTNYSVTKVKYSPERRQLIFLLLYLKCK